VYASSAGALWVTELGITNTTVTAFECSLKRLTTTGTQGTAQTVVWEENDGNFSARGDPRDTHTVAPTLVAGELRRASIGASIGSGVIWTFGGRGLFIPAGTTNAVGLMPMTGTGQIFDVYMSWDS